MWTGSLVNAVTDLTMKKIKSLFYTLLLLMALPTAAQQKLFTLEDLNFGGTNYHNLRPKNLQLTWWGDRLVRTDVEECYLVDLKTGREKLLFTLENINKWAGSDDERYVRHLMNATFPYPDKTIVSVGNRHAVIHIDFKKQQVVWQDSISGQTANDWNSVSKATAFVEDNQLCVADGQGVRRQLTKDGSREIVYGQSVHRNEFGIEKGTFWSPDGQRLAFYRMDQSMVTDYPQVDIFPREATHEPDKYPMAGMTSHKVTVGVYDLKTDKTVYLKAGDPTDRYFTNIAWSPDSKTVYMFELNRGQEKGRSGSRALLRTAEYRQSLAVLGQKAPEKNRGTGPWRRSCHGSVRKRIRRRTGAQQRSAVLWLRHRRRDPGSPGGRLAHVSIRPECLRRDGLHGPPDRRRSHRRLKRSAGSSR